MALESVRCFFYDILQALEEAVVERQQDMNLTPVFKPIKKEKKKKKQQRDKPCNKDRHSRGKMQPNICRVLSRRW